MARILPKYKQLLIFFYCLTIHFNINANEIKQCKRLVIAGAQSWYPYSYVKTGEQYYRGVLLTSLAKAIQGRDITLSHWADIPWKRTEINLDNGKIDIILGAFHTKERANKWFYSKPLANAELALFSLKHISDIETLDNIRNKVIAYPYGMATGKKFSAIKPYIKTEHIVRHEQIYGMLLKQRADFGLLPKIAIQTYLKQHHLTREFKIHPIALNSEDIYLVTSINNPCLTVIKDIFGDLQTM